MLQKLKYSLRVWVTGGILSPFVFSLLNELSGRGFFPFSLDFADSFRAFGFFLVFGLVYSIPGLLMLWLVTTLLENTDMIVTFHLFPHGGIPMTDSPYVQLFFAYFGTISGAIGFYNLEKAGATPDANIDEA